MLWAVVDGWMGEALAQAQKASKIAHVGLSKVSVEQLRAAQSEAPIASVQNRYNMLEREHDDMIDLTAREGTAFIPYRTERGTATDRESKPSGAALLRLWASQDLGTGPEVFERSRFVMQAGWRRLYLSQGMLL